MTRFHNDHTAHLARWITHNPTFLATAKAKAHSADLTHYLCSLLADRLDDGQPVTNPAHLRALRGVYSQVDLLRVNWADIHAEVAAAPL